MSIIKLSLRSTPLNKPFINVSASPQGPYLALAFSFTVTTNSSSAPINAKDIHIKIYKTPTQGCISRLTSDFGHFNPSASVLILLKTDTWETGPWLWAWDVELGNSFSESMGKVTSTYQVFSTNGIPDEDGLDEWSESVLKQIAR